MRESNSKPLVFLAFANSSANPLPSLADECRRLTNIFEAAAQKGICDLLVRPYVTVEELLDTFEQPAYHNRIAVFHYAGHAESYALLLEEAGAAPSIAYAGGLAAFLGQQPGLQLVFLNGCSTQPQVAQLLEAGINVVIATSQAIADQIATDFAAHFYRYLTGLDCIEHAYAKTQAALQTLYGDDSANGEWPWHLYQRPDAVTATQWTLNDAATAKLLPFEPQTVLIPAGPFLMGSAPGPGIPAYETPQHTMDLPAYRIGTCPVTNRQYAEFLRQNKQQEAPAQSGWFLREPPKEQLDHPVAGVSWRDAVAYCDWLSRTTGRHYCLPSEAEWEKAARGTDARRYPWGDEWANSRCNVNKPASTPVDRFGEGASPYGCMDMLGNVQEWTRTLWGTQPQEPDFAYPYDREDGREIEDPNDLPPQARLVQRGGSFRSQADELRCAARNHAASASKIAWRGFRVAMQIKEST